MINFTQSYWVGNSIQNIHITIIWFLSDFGARVHTYFLDTLGVPYSAAMTLDKEKFWQRLVTATAWCLASFQYARK